MRQFPVRPDYVHDAERRASAVRAELGLGSDAIGDLFELLGHLGLEVVRWPMGETGPDGFYVRKGDLALVVVNSAKRLERQRFTAAHELGHHLFDSQSRVDANIFASDLVPERRANVFAAHLLMPEEGVRRWLRRDGQQGEGPFPLVSEKVVHLTRHFGMSFEATLYQLRDLGWLETGRIDELKTVSPDRIARRLGYDLDMDLAERNRQVLPADFVRRALEAYGACDISLVRLAELLRTSAEGAERLAQEAGVEPAEPSLEELAREARDA